MKHQLHMLFKTALRQRLNVFITCLLFGISSAWADPLIWPVAVWDATTSTLYFDCYEDYGDGDDMSPVVGSTWTTSEDETVTVSMLWSKDQVENTGTTTPGWVISDIQNACTKVVITYFFNYSYNTSCYQWFYGFKNLTSIENLSNLNMYSVTTMYGMFDGCAKLKSINLIGLYTDKVTDMSRMFAGCSKLESLKLSTFKTSKVNNMQGMFSGCTNLKTIYVDENNWTTASVTNGTGMFTDCTSLKGGSDKYSVTYSSDHTDHTYACVGKSASPGYLTAGTVFAGWNEAWKQLTFGFGEVPKTNVQTDYGIFTQVWSGIDAINRSWQSSTRSTCTKVRFSGGFPEGVNMEEWFNSFKKLETVERFDYVTPGNTNSMFRYCSKLSSISLPSGMKRIGHSMFQDCSSLTKMYIPANVTSIGYGAFITCTTLPAFTVSTSNKHFVAEDGVLFTTDKKELVAYPVAKTATEYTIPNGVTTIRDYAFCSNQSLISVTLPSSVSEIGKFSFESCSNISSVQVYMPQPPFIYYSQFWHISDNARLYVPYGCSDAYKNAEGWKNFKNIYEYDETYAIWDATTKTLYFDEDNSNNTTVPVVGSTWQTSKGKTITVTKIWSGDEVEKTQGFPGWSEVAGECEMASIESWGIVPESFYGWFNNFKKLKCIKGFEGGDFGIM